MKILGRPGTVSGLMMRTGQFGFAAASISAMLSSGDTSKFTAFSYLVASMGFQVLYSFALACLDAYALKKNRDLQNPVSVSFFAIGDWVTSMLSLAAACSSAGIIVLYLHDFELCNRSHLPCLMYEISVIFAFIAWGLLFMSFQVMLWILASFSNNPHL
ncbi:CASP-like protein 5B2 [Punica granatum]|uniref:CASP-like protein n=2 Tax=Punica granatum TaxID=22663 RepID=A0A218W339_PUNGR|nr:CASP-like protein 5B2 [Punica granatum]OWM67185.1 hypothetical protein CDL15_Pgr000637 [Punica granatum]PKI72215.1 hypothetical protein CRG98_007413 [Punica granatum]